MVATKLARLEGGNGERKKPLELDETIQINAQPVNRVSEPRRFESHFARGFYNYFNPLATATVALHKIGVSGNVASIFCFQHFILDLSTIKESIIVESLEDKFFLSSLKCFIFKRII